MLVAKSDSNYGMQRLEEEFDCCNGLKVCFPDMTTLAYSTEILQCFNMPFASIMVVHRNLMVCKYLRVDDGLYVREWSWGAAAAVHAAAGAAAAAGIAADGAAAGCWGLPKGEWLRQPMTGAQDGKQPASGPSADRSHAVGLPELGHAPV